MEIYAKPGTIHVETRDFHFPRQHGPLYRVWWLDPEGHHRSTPMTLRWGEAYLLADKLEHGEPYIREEWLN